jgi:hypothetical protein
MRAKKRRDVDGFFGSIIRSFFVKFAGKSKCTGKEPDETYDRAFKEKEEKIQNTKNTKKKKEFLRCRR